ncbi:MAG: SURF1 family protein, partial [Chitinophagaceae bacterium]|nr:SURF1 family protein [Rubrivivax sp.]
MKARAWVVLLASVLTVVGMARLGLWQLDRAAQKTALQQSLDTRRQLPPLMPPELARDATQASMQHDRHIVLHGRWLARATVYLDNRQMNGRPGFFVVTPLLLPDGTAVVVQRGWQPRDMADRARVVRPPTPEDVQVRVQGRIAPPPGRLYEFAGAELGPIRQNLPLEAYAREAGVDLRPLSLLQADDRETASDGLLRQWPQPAAGVQRHHGYAFQWFALAALVLGL